MFLVSFVLLTVNDFDQLNMKKDLDQHRRSQDLWIGQSNAFAYSDERKLLTVVKEGEFVMTHPRIKARRFEDRKFSSLPLQSYVCTRSVTGNSSLHIGHL